MFGTCVYSVIFLTLMALGPRSDSSISYSTWSPSLRFSPGGTAVRCTKMSFSSSPSIKPKPFMSLYHLIVPFIFCVSPPQTVFLSGVFEKSK